MQGHKVVVKRTELKYTQEQLADKLNISRQTLAKIEHDQGSPSLSLALKIAEILGCELSELL